MEQLTQLERLTKVKTALGFGGNFQDEALEIYIDEVLQVLIDGGVREEVALSNASIGAIVLGVNDLYNYSSGEVKYSDAFVKRLIQLSKKKMRD